ncbi:MAG: hypothetical protein ACYDC6_15225 [Acidobacteriaceae bacterium]
MLRQIVGLIFGIATVAAGWGQVGTTTVQDTVFNADGSYATGTILVRWPAFVTATGNTVAAGHLDAQIGANGQVVLNLAPNVGANPAGSYYTAVYHLAGNAVSTEYWSIPNVPSTSIAAIRSLVMPASEAVQVITATEVNTLLGKYLPLSGGTLSGALQLPADPQSAMQAATKNYVDTSVAPLASAISGAVIETPKSSQIIQQPASTTLIANSLENHYLASQYQSPASTGNNGIEQLMGGANCSSNSPTTPSGCTVIADPGYANADTPQGTLVVNGQTNHNFGWPLNTHLHDERNGITADYYENPFSTHPLQNSGDLKETAYTLDFQKWPAYSADNMGTEYLYTEDFQGGYNFDNYMWGTPEYFFKTYYTNLNMESTNYSSGQMQAINNVVNCHGTGDCLAMSTYVTCDGGVNTSNDEGCHGGDWNVSEDSVVYVGTMNAATAVGATSFSTNATNGGGTEGQDRLLLDTASTAVISGNSITGYTASVPTGPSLQSAVNPNIAIDSAAAYPVSTMIQLCYPGSDNGASGAAGCTSGNQPTGYIPPAPNMINPAPSITANVVASYTAGAPQTGLPAGFCTPGTLQSTSSTAACYLPASGVACISDQEEYETVNYTYNSTAQTVTLLNLRFPHLNGVFFAHGGLCGYAAEQASDIFTGDGNNNGISQVFPVLGSPNATSFYYISQRTNIGYTEPILGISNDQNGNGTSGGGECFTINIFAFSLLSDNHTVGVAGSVPFGDGTLSDLNGLSLNITTPNGTYNGTYTATWGTYNTSVGVNWFTYYLPTTPTGTVPTSGTATFCNTNYKLYPSVRVVSVLNPSTNNVDGTMTTMPAPLAFAFTDPVKQPHYQWINTAHDIGRGVNQYLPREYVGGYLYGMTYNFLLSGMGFQGFSISNATDQNKYLRYGGTHEVPSVAYNVGGSWVYDFNTGAPEQAVINVAACKPSPIGCNSLNSPFNFLRAPNNNEVLNYDPKTQTWTFGNVGNLMGNPPVPTTGTLAAYNIAATNQVGVNGGYLFNVGGAIAVTNTPATPSFNNWFANYAYGFGAQNTTVIDGFLYRGAAADSIDCGTGTGNTDCTFTAGVVNAGTSVNTPTVAATASVTTPSLTVGGGTAVTHIAYLATGTIAPTAVAAATCSDQSFPVGSLTTADQLGSITPPGALGNVSVSGYAGASGTVVLHFCNVSTSSVTPPAGVYTFLGMH